MFMLCKYLICYLMSFIILLECSNLHPYSNVYAKYEGDIYLAGLFSMHHYVFEGKCGDLIEQDGLQVLAAAMYGLDRVTDMKILPIKIGLLAIDTCQNTEYAIGQSREFMQFKMNNIGNTFKCADNSTPHINKELESFQNVFGVFGAGNSDVSMSVSTYLKLIELPQLSYFSTSHLLSDKDKYPSFFRTIPSDSYLILAIIKLMKFYKWTYLILINDYSEYSKQMTIQFKQLIDNESLICIAKEFTIQRGANASRFNFIMELEQKVKESISARIILTFLMQPVAEDLFDYLQNSNNQDLSKLLWIATDSWGGRNWENIKNSSAVLNHMIAVVPKAFNNSDFMKFYKNRLPSVINNDPWIAEKFENSCNCQYKNQSEFIYLELEKIRPHNSSAVSCQSIEQNCANQVYRDSQQMLYIHYVIDGILAYAYTIKKLLPEICLSYSKACSDSLFKNKILSMSNIVREMRAINFTDSTGKEFRFIGQDGIPFYSIVHFKKSENTWEIVGNISENLSLSVTESFHQHIIENHTIPDCAPPCSSDQAKSFIKIDCCWKCTKCQSNEIITVDNSSVVKEKFLSQQCSQCKEGKYANREKNSCDDIKESYMSFNDSVALSLLFINMIGLLGCLISCTIMIIYWKTPIIKALGRETSTIILIGSILSFVMSIILLDKPNRFFCYIRWYSPGICSTLCYAAILTKLNRIARIFGIKVSSKRNLRFVSTISQINIVLIITTAECIIITVILLTKEVDVYHSKNRVLNCKDVDTSSIIAIFLIPSFLLMCSTIYAFKIRKTPDGFNETRNINFLNFSNCVVLVTCLMLHHVLKDNQYSVLPFCMLLTLGAHGNILGLFFPKIYIILFRPSKNTRQAVLTKSRSKSELSVSHSPSISSGIEAQNSKLNNVRCRRCNQPLVTSVEMDILSRDHSNSDNLKEKSKTKVNFVNFPNNDIDNSETFNVSSAGVGNESDNKTFTDDL